VLALVDSDPYGLKILSVYCSGSKGMSYDSNHLTTPDIKWLGVRYVHDAYRWMNKMGCIEWHAPIYNVLT
jgi:DNA topoisomerase VI subunit A